MPFQLFHREPVIPVDRMPCGSPPPGAFVCKVFIAKDLGLDFMRTPRVKVSGFKGLADWGMAKS